MCKILVRYRTYPQCVVPAAIVIAMFGSVAMVITRFFVYKKQLYKKQKGYFPRNLKKQLGLSYES